MKQFIFVILGLCLLGLIAFIAWPESNYEAYEVSESYQAQVDAFTVPDMPADWVWSKFVSDDGVSLRYGQTGNSGSARATVVIIPGYTATMTMYGEHAADIAARGYHVVGFDLRGQGGSDRARRSQPEKLLIDDFKTYSNDVALFLESLNLPEERPVILLGMSFGGHVSFRVAGEHSDLVDGLVLLAPALKPKAGDTSFEDAARLLRIGRALGKGKRYLPGHGNWTPYNEDNLLVAGIEHCASSPKRLPLRDAIYTVEPEQRVGGVTFDWGHEFYESSIFVRQPGYPESISKPVAMVHAELDNFVVTDVNKDVCDARMSDCISVPIDGGGHCLMQETDPVLDIIYNTLDDVVQRAVVSLN